MPPFGLQLNFETTSTTTPPALQLKISTNSPNSNTTPSTPPDPSTFTIDPILIRALRNRPQLREDFLKAIREDREASNGH